MGTFDGMTALVTGGASGIGAAVAAELTVRGARVAVLDRDAAKAPDGGVTVTADVTDDVSVTGAVAEAVAALGGLDTLVHCAGVGGVTDNDDAEWHRVLDVNVVGPVRVTRAALPALRESGRRAPGRPSIISIGSIVVTAGLPSRALYSASKGALTALSQAMAADLLPEGIRVNIVHPGTADTPWVGRLLAAAGDPVAERAALEARQPHGRLVTAAEVADAVAYLAGPGAGSTTGTALSVDGGMQGLRLRPRNP